MLLGLYRPISQITIHLKGTEQLQVSPPKSGLSHTASSPPLRPGQRTGHANTAKDSSIHTDRRNKQTHRGRERAWITYKVRREGEKRRGWIAWGWRSRWTTGWGADGQKPGTAFKLDSKTHWEVKTCLVEWRVVRSLSCYTGFTVLSWIVASMWCKNTTEMCAIII